jgi:hypothetical protein
MKTNTKGNLYRFRVLFFLVPLFLVISLIIFSSCELFLLPLQGRTNPNDEGAPFQNLRNIVMSDLEIEIRWDWPTANEEEGIEVPKRVKIERFLKKADNEREPSWDKPIEFIVDKETGTWPAANFSWNDTDFAGEPIDAGYVYEFSWSYGTTIFSSWYDGINIDASRQGNFYGIDPMIDGYADTFPSEKYNTEDLYVEKDTTGPFDSGAALQFPDVSTFLAADYAAKVTHLYLNLTTREPPSEVLIELEVFPLTALLVDGDTYANISGMLDNPNSISITTLPDIGGSNFTIDITSQKDNTNIWNGLALAAATVSPDGWASFHSSRSEDERARPRLYVQYYGEIDWSGL